MRVRINLCVHTERPQWTLGRSAPLSTSSSSFLLFFLRPSRIDPSSAQEFQGLMREEKGGEEKNLSFLSFLFLLLLLLPSPVRTVVGPSQPGVFY